MGESFVYILASRRNGTLYVGSTTNWVKRVWEHKNKVIPGFTAKYGVHQLVYYEMHQNIMEAARRERRNLLLTGSRGQAAGRRSGGAN